MAVPAQALDHACKAIYARWLRFVPEPEALEQAQAFRQRCEALAAQDNLTEQELDQTLAIVADSMGMAV